MSAVWQTLDNLAGNNLFRLNEGTQLNWLKSFSKKDLLDSIVKSQWIKSDVNQNENLDITRDSSNFEIQNDVTVTYAESSDTRKKRKRKRKRNNVNMHKRSPRLADRQPTEIGCIVECNYNIPNITARLEGLMGSNVVRLTDRIYMEQLRQCHEADCNAKLQKRIERREALEIERERTLIMQGKLSKISGKLTNHPVFQIDQRAKEVISRRRARLKTTREKNAERLQRLGTKWERDRLIFERQAEEKAVEMESKRGKLSDQEEQYKEEDAVRGMDLLRIHDKEWKLCEMDLKNFLEKEHAAMNKGLLSEKVAQTNDPLDVMNIVKARKKFRETEEKIRRVLEDQVANSKELRNSKQYLVHTATASAVSRKVAEEDTTQKETEATTSTDKDQHQNKKVVLKTEAALSSEENELETDTDHASKLQKRMDDEIKNNLIMTKEKFNALHYEDPLIAELKKTANVHDLYRVARDIICPEKVDAEKEQNVNEGKDENDNDNVTVNEKSK